MKPCLLFLTCSDKAEAEKISQILLDKKLVTCIKQVLTNSSYLWKNKIEKASEVLLIMDSVENNFEKIDKELKKAHSYDTYTLVLTKIDKFNKKASNWISKELA